MGLSTLFGLLVVLLLVAANAFFVAAEFALVRAKPSRIAELAEGGDRLARSVLRAQKDLDHAISGTQLGITLASLGLGWVAEPSVAVVLERVLASMALQVSGVALHATAIILTFAFIAYLHIVLGELAPKTAALASPERVSRFVAVPLNAFSRLTAPAIWLLNGSADIVLRLVGLEATGSVRVHSPEEIEMLVKQSRDEGVVEEDEQAMIHGVFELTRTIAREVMTPRPDIVAVEADAGLDVVLDVASESGFSRLPVYEESLDRIVGIVVVKDLLPWLRKDEELGLVTARELARDATFVPDTKPVDDLLAELRRDKGHMVLVVDEFGGTDGVVTMEDVLEEIVGEIYDEHDVPQPEVVEEPGGRIFLDGGYSFNDLIERFQISPVGEDHDTVAGFVIGHLGRIPEVGERVSLGDAALVVSEVTDQRVTRLEFKPAPASAVDDEREAV